MFDFRRAISRSFKRTDGKEKQTCQFAFDVFASGRQAAGEKTALVHRQRQENKEQSQLADNLTTGYVSTFRMAAATFRTSPQ